MWTQYGDWVFFKPQQCQWSFFDIVSDTVGATCCPPPKTTKTDGRWKEAPGDRAYVSVTPRHWDACAWYCHHCSLTQCASADQRTASHPVSVLLILSYRPSWYFNGWRAFLLQREGPQWPWRLAVASFKQEPNHITSGPLMMLCPSNIWISTSFLHFFYHQLPLNWVRFCEF